jgi:hypothetical protein
LSIVAEALFDNEYQDGADAGKTNMRQVHAMQITRVVPELPNGCTMVGTNTKAGPEQL